MYFPSDFRRVKGRTVGAIVDHGYADKIAELSEVRGTSVSTEVRRAIRESLSANITFECIAYAA